MGIQSSRLCNTGRQNTSWKETMCSQQFLSIFVSGSSFLEQIMTSRSVINQHFDQYENSNEGESLRKFEFMTDTGLSLWKTRNVNKSIQTFLCYKYNNNYIIAFTFPPFFCKFKIISWRIKNEAKTKVT